MANANELSAHTIRSNFDHFRRAYPDVEHRHEAARQLADPEGFFPIDNGVEGRSFLAAHWGEGLGELKQRAEFLYRLKHEVDGYVGQPVLVLEKGSLEDIVAEEQKIYDEIEFGFGFISADELSHGFQGRLTAKGPTRMGVKPPYLGFGVRVPVVSGVKVKTDLLLGKIQVEKLSDRDPNLPVYIGTVPVPEEPNVDAYRGGKRLEQRTIMMGERCAIVLEALRIKGNKKISQALAKVALGKIRAA